MARITQRLEIKLQGENLRVGMRITAPGRTNALFSTLTVPNRPDDPAVVANLIGYVEQARGEAARSLTQASLLAGVE